MSLKQLVHKKIEAAIHVSQRFTDRIWYPPLIGLLAFLDAFVIIIPTDGLLISSVLLKPKRWINLALCVSIGSTFGALILFYLVKSHGLPVILNFFPGIDNGEMWIWTETFFQKYGLLLVFFVAATPLFQHPAIILAALAHTNFFLMLFVTLAGRILKYMIMAYISSHSPRLITKMWGVKEELDEVGIHMDSTIHKPRHYKN